MNTKSVPNFNICFVETLQVHMLISWGIEYWASSIPHTRTFRNFRHWARPIQDMSNHDVFRIIPDPAKTWAIMTCFGSFPTQAAKRGFHCFWNPLAQFHFKPGPVISGFQSTDRMVATTECHAVSVFLPHFTGHGISPIGILVHFLGLQWISFPILPIVRFSRQASWAPKNLSTESDPKDTWLAQSSLLLEANHAYPTTIYMCSARCIFGNFPSVWCRPVHNWGATAMGDVAKGTEYIWKYPCCIMWWR